MSHELKLGDRLEVSVNGRNCISDVQDITGHLVISAPMYRGATIPLTVGALLRVSYYRPGGMYSFMANVVKRYRSGELDLVDMDVKSTVNKYQRREFVRLETVIPLSVRLIALPEHFLERTPEQVLRLLCDTRFAGVPRPRLEGEEIFQCYTTDLSGGGACFVSNEKFEQGSLIENTFHLNEYDEVTTDGQIVRVDACQDRLAGWRVSVQYVNIDERVRRRFIKFIFTQQTREHQQAQ